MWNVREVYFPYLRVQECHQQAIEGAAGQVRPAHEYQNTPRLRKHRRVVMRAHDHLLHRISAQVAVTAEPWYRHAKANIRRRRDMGNNIIFEIITGIE